MCNLSNASFINNVINTQISGANVSGIIAFADNSNVTFDNMTMNGFAYTSLGIFASTGVANINASTLFVNNSFFTSYVNFQYNYSNCFYGITSNSIFTIYNNNCNLPNISCNITDYTYSEATIGS